MVRHAEKYYFPLRESIQSALPLADEFILALGQGDDATEEWAKSINDPKLKIYDRVWDERKFSDSRILKEETDFAMSKCQGDWILYIQADELLHEADYAEIREACLRYRDNLEVQGLLFNYHHFWGDYEHELRSHAWYRQEIRIVRNHIGIASYKDAQSFRTKEGQRLQVKALKASVYHYGWVRPPELMQSKKKEHDAMHQGRAEAEKLYKEREEQFDYGPLARLSRFKGSHPAVMKDWMAKMHWKESLNYGNKGKVRPYIKHERLKYRIISAIENRLLGGKTLFGYKNWKLLKD